MGCDDFDADARAEQQAEREQRATETGGCGWEGCTRPGHAAGSAEHFHGEAGRAWLVGYQDGLNDKTPTETVGVSSARGSGVRDSNPAQTEPRGPACASAPATSLAVLRTERARHRKQNGDYRDWYRQVCSVCSVQRSEPYYNERRSWREAEDWPCVTSQALDAALTALDFGTTA